MDTRVFPINQQEKEGKTKPQKGEKKGFLCGVIVPNRLTDLQVQSDEDRIRRKEGRKE